jgi:uncharacterized protein with PIN domain
MVIDTVAIVLDEPSRDFLRKALQAAPTRIISSVSLATGKDFAATDLTVVSPASGT